MRIAREEVFGPVVSLIEFTSFEEAIEIVTPSTTAFDALYTRDVNAPSPPCATGGGITYINAPPSALKSTYPSAASSTPATASRRPRLD